MLFIIILNNATRDGIENSLTTFGENEQNLLVEKKYNSPPGGREGT